MAVHPGFSVSGNVPAELAGYHRQQPFLALAKKCTPTVVNVKVTKVEKTRFWGDPDADPFPDSGSFRKIEPLGQDRA